MARSIAVIGLGYAGLHAALAFGKVQQVIGYDIDQTRIDELNNNIDSHGDFSKAEIKSSKVKFTTNPNDLKACDFYIIIMSTPIDNEFNPDFSFLKTASKLIGGILKKGDIVIYESTVYPGATEEVCVPILEKNSHLRLGADFKVGYSPERINPGDKIHTFENTVKIVSGSDKNALKIITDEYSKITEKVFCVTNIKTAEAVKITENIQRDVNIALVNELAQIFHLLGIDTQDVMSGAETKWNFISYKPGFAGGHCIGVDPYYLIYKAKKLGFYPKIMSACRDVNETMSNYICKIVIKQLVKNKLVTKATRVAILGMTYKENYNDIRNSKSADLGSLLQEYAIDVYYTDPHATAATVNKEYSISLTKWQDLPTLNAIIITVGHQQFRERSPAEYASKLVKGGLIFDMKNTVDREQFAKQGIKVWRL